MAVPSKPTGQDPQSQLLWQISKQLEYLITVASTPHIETTTTTTTI